MRKAPIPAEGVQNGCWCRTQLLCCMLCCTRTDRETRERTRRLSGNETLMWDSVASRHGGGGITAAGVSVVFASTHIRHINTPPKLEHYYMQNDGDAFLWS